MWLAENTRRKKNYGKNRHLHIAQLCGAIYSQLRHVSTIGKKSLNSSISFTFPHKSQYDELRLTNGRDRLVSLGHPNNLFNGFCLFASLLHRSRSAQVNQTLHYVWPSPGLVPYHFRGLLRPNAILSGAKFTLCPSLAFSYIDGVTAQHSSSGRQPNCGVQQRAPPIFGRAAITLGIGPHSSYRTFTMPPARLSSVCSVRAPYSGGWNFLQFFYAIWYRGYPLMSAENFTEIVPGEPLRQWS